MRFQKRPEWVEAIQWRPEMGILRGTQGFGCIYCFPNVCVSSAHHEQGPRPHHLMLQTVFGVQAVFAGDWIVTYSDRRRYQDRYSDAEFQERFSATALLLLETTPPAAVPEAASLHQQLAPDAEPSLSSRSGAGKRKKEPS